MLWNHPDLENMKPFADMFSISAVEKRDIIEIDLKSSFQNEDLTGSVLSNIIVIGQHKVCS